MSAPTVAVTCTANDQSGNPVAGARFRAKLDQTEIYGGFVVPEVIEVVANDLGIAILPLWPNALGVAGSLYAITAVNPDTGKKFLSTTISVPNSACNLHEILVQAPYPTVDAAAQALIAAQGALAPVVAQAVIATARAAEAVEMANSATESALASAARAQTSGLHALESLSDADRAADSAAAAALSAQAAADSAGLASGAVDAADLAAQKAQEALDSQVAAAGSAQQAGQSAIDADAAAGVYGDFQGLFAQQAASLVTTQAILANLIALNPSLNL